MDKEIQLEEFENYLKFQNMSENTIRSYLYAIRQYYKLFPELTYSNLQLYKLYLLEHYKPQTVNLRIHALNCFLNYSEWPDEKILQVRIQQKGYLDRIISEGDYEYLKSRLLSNGQYLYYFLIRFMAATGARVSELVQIKAEHLRLGYMDLYSKGGKIRGIYFPDRLCTEGLEWLKSKGTASGFIFLKSAGKTNHPARDQQSAEAPCQTLPHRPGHGLSPFLPAAFGCFLSFRRKAAQWGERTAFSAAPFESHGPAGLEGGASDSSPF